MYTFTLVKTTIPYSDPEWITLLKQRDKEAWEYLFNNYAGSLYGLVKAIIPGEMQAGKAMEDAFLSIYRSIEIYDPAKSRLFTWLLQVTRESALNSLRSIKTTGMIPALHNEEAGMGSLTSNLDKEQQHLVQLAYFEGQSTGEIARKMKVTANAVNQRIKLALANINKKV